MLDNTLEGLGGKLLAYMVKKSRLTPDDMAKLRALLDRQSAAVEADRTEGGES